MPGWLTGRSYQLPERFTPEEARRNALQSTLDKITAQRKRLEVERVSLSRASNQFHFNRLKEFESKFGAELEARRRRVAELQRRNLSMQSPIVKSALSRFFQLQQRRAALLQRASAERRENQFKKSFVDRRRFSFGDQSPRTVFGTRAWVVNRVDEVTRRVFRNPLLSLPCIGRSVRREVMFAKRHAGKGHKVRHRRSVFSHIGC